MGKIQRRVEKIAGKHFIVYVYSAPGVAKPSILIGPRYIVVVANSEVEASDIGRFLESNPKCMRCGKYSSYFRVEVRPDGADVVCGDCDPTVKFATKYFEFIDLILPF